MYSPVLLDHFTNPRNIGTLDNPDGYARVTSPGCGDQMELFLRVTDERISDIRYRAFGCAAAIASSSMASEMIKGRTLEEASRLTGEEVSEELGGLPEAKFHCAIMAASAINAALRDYCTKHPTVPFCTSF
ncbi:MAG: iron-sulfur cluster assembly scaffold protein [Chloroflexi bacterium]|nr:iron-sulfur cluster assembly scaffold protein [Chloroflexota bacterium]